MSLSFAKIIFLNILINAAHMHRHSVNLNLLAALDALLQEEHVGRAAERVGVTQSAMSHSLRQLRELLDDPLLVRDGHRMVPTPRAESLVPLLERGLLALDAVLQAPQDPNPSGFTQQFTVALQDIPSAILLPSLFERMQREAPLASLAVVAPSPTLGDDLLHGRTHIAMVPPFAAPRGLVTRMLPSRSDAGWVVAGRTDHPALQGEQLTLDDYCELPHVMVSVTGRGGSWVDELLAESGRERRIALRLPYGLASPLPLLSSDAVLTVPELAARHFAELWPITWTRTPFEGPAPSEMLLGWHGRFDTDPAHQWFRELFFEEASTV